MLSIFLCLCSKKFKKMNSPPCPNVLQSQGTKTIQKEKREHSETNLDVMRC